MDAFCPLVSYIVSILNTSWYFVLKYPYYGSCGTWCFRGLPLPDRQQSEISIARWTMQPMVFLHVAYRPPSYHLTNLTDGPNLRRLIVAPTDFWDLGFGFICYQNSQCTDSLMVPKLNWIHVLGSVYYLLQSTSHWPVWCGYEQV